MAERRVAAACRGAVCTWHSIACVASGLIGRRGQELNGLEGERIEEEGGWQLDLPRLWTWRGLVGVTFDSDGWCLSLCTARCGAAWAVNSEVVVTTRVEFVEAQDVDGAIKGACGGQSHCRFGEARSC